MCAQLTLWATDRSTCSLAPVAGALRHGSQDGPMTVPCGPAHAHASLSASQASSAEPMTSAIYGPSCATSSASADLQSSLESRLRAALAGAGSPLYVLTWKHWDMRSGPPICALRASALRISDSAYTGERSGWPTPDASVFEAANMERLMKRRQECRSRHGNGNGFGLTLRQAVTLLCSGWTTPVTNDATGSTHCYGPMRPDGTRPRYLKLPGQVQAPAAGWTTPTTRDHKDGASAGTVDANGLLGRQVWTHGSITDGSCAPTDERGRLHPSHAGWMMGYPPEWDSCGVSAMQSCRKSRRRSSRRSRGNDG
jgi:hypothetical protein